MSSPRLRKPRARAFGSFRLYYLNSIVLLFGVFAAALVVPVARAQTPTKGDHNVNVAAILEQLRLSLNRTRSIQYKGEYHWHGPARPKPPRTIHYRFEYIVDGNLFYSSFDSQLEDVRVSQVQAYNGKDYQEIRQDKVLERTSTLQPRGSKSFSGLIQPIAAQFTFAFAGPPYDFSILLRRSTWDQLTASVSQKADELYEGRPCTVLSFRREKLSGRFEYSVYLDKAFDYYPVKVAHRASDGGSRFESVATVSRIATAHGDVVVPIRISSVALRHTASRKEEVTETTEYTIEPKSLRVNRPMDRNVFTLKADDAKGGVYDLDSRTWLSRPSDGPKGSRTSAWILVGLSVPVVIGLVIACRRFVRKEQKRGSRTGSGT